MASPIEGLKSNKPNLKEPKHDIYADASMGPFKCSNCEYFTAPDQCGNKFIVNLRGSKVEPEACCDLFEKKD